MTFPLEDPGFTSQVYTALFEAVRRMGQDYRRMQMTGLRPASDEVYAQEVHISTTGGDIFFSLEVSTANARALAEQFMAEHLADVDDEDDDEDDDEEVTGK